MVDEAVAPNREVDAGGGHSSTAAELFALLWATLGDVIGSAATATLLRRAAKALLARRPDLTGLRIIREGLEYHYVTPESWLALSEETVSAFRELAGELSPILYDLTGVVVAHRLDNIVQFQRNGIRFGQGRSQ